MKFGLKEMEMYVPMHCFVCRVSKKSPTHIRTFTSIFRTLISQVCLHCPIIKVMKMKFQLKEMVFEMFVSHQDFSRP